MQKKDVMSKKWAPKSKTSKKSWEKAALDAHVLHSVAAAEATQLREEVSQLVVESSQSRKSSFHGCKMYLTPINCWTHF
jgi:hypothetical protein